MPPSNLELWRAWAKAKGRTSRAAFAARYGLAPKSLDNRLYLGKLESQYRELHRPVEITAAGRPWSLKGDFIIVGDVHVPYTDYGFASLVGAAARAAGIRRLIIAGDFFNMDSFSRYDQIIQQPTWAQEREAAKSLILQWLDDFDEIYMTMGNHDRRLQKFTAGEFDESDILALIYSNPERVKLNVYGWCNVESGGFNWRVTHPRNYSVGRLSVANNLAQKHQSHIITFHEHHLGITQSRYGGFVVVNGGCLIDPAKVPYAVLDDTQSPDWVQGFVMLRDGVPTLLGEEPFTDWRRVLGGLYDNT